MAKKMVPGSMDVLTAGDEAARQRSHAERQMDAAHKFAQRVLRHDPDNDKDGNRDTDGGSGMLRPQ